MLVSEVRWLRSIRRPIAFRPALVGTGGETGGASVRRETGPPPRSGGGKLEALLASRMRGSQMRSVATRSLPLDDHYRRAGGRNPVAPCQIASSVERDISGRA